MLKIIYQALFKKNMKKRVVFSLFIFLAISAFLFWLVTPTEVFARDPYPNKERQKYMVSPTGAANANPATMLRNNGKRSDIISFSCYFGGKQNHSHSLNDISIDTLAKATTACNNDTEWRNYADVKEVRKPYLKNNKNVAVGEEKYDAYGYDWPVGDYLWDGTNHPGSMWATPLVYPSGQPIYRHPSCHANDPDPAKRGICDCIHKPMGPDSTWIHMTWGSLECMAPPYTTEGSTWWENYLKPEIQRIRNGADINKIAAVGIFLGIDGEGRPLKSMEGWVPDDPDLVNRFHKKYIPAVAKLIKSLYPGKTIRAHTDSPDPDLLENDIDFHRESLASDQYASYIYKGATGGFPPFGHWQAFANFFYLTNSGGFAPAWPPYYQSVMGALSQHTDAITGFMDLYGTGLYEEGRGTFLKFAGSYIGKDINDTPGVWINLRETIHKKEAGVNISGKYGDFDYFLYRPENLDNNKTIPVLTDELPYKTSSQIYNWKLPLARWGYPTDNQYVGRKNAAGNRYMSFDVDDGWRYANQPGVAVDLRIVYLDDVSQTFYLEYKNQDNQWVRKPITKTGATQKWQEITLSIDDAYFNNSASEDFSNATLYPTDFRIDSEGSPVIIHLVEVKGRGTLTNPLRPKVQVSCDIIKNINDDPKEGVYSPGLNQDYIIKARLTDNNGNPIAGERIMFTYNTEWNLATSYNTNLNGLAFHALNTANNLNSSGFVMGDQYKSYKVSWYSVQVFYPGNDKYQPSRNDCYLPITDSIVNNNTANDTKIKITNIDTSQTSVTKKAKVTYQLIHRTNGLLKTVTQDIGKAEGFYADDPNAQTVVISNADYRLAFNNITLNGTPAIPPIPDTTPPSVPTNLTATAVSSSQINLAWTASTDNVGVTGYRIYRAGTQIATTNTTSYQNTGLSPSTAYAYTVAAYDAAGNVSGQSGSASATTPLTSTNYDPIGGFDTADTTHVAGWAYDQNAATSPITVDIYIDGTNRASVTANLSRPDIMGAGGGIVQDANHGFNFSLTGLNLSSGTHTINIYAINTPTGNNPLLDGSPKTITIAATTQSPYPGPNPTPIPGIIEAENFDNGGEGVAYHDLDSGNTGSAYRSTDVDIQACSEGGFNLGYINAGEWLEYTINIASAGTYDVEARVAAAYNGGGNFHLEFNGVNKTGTLTIADTGGWSNWQTIKKTGVNLTAGQQVMKLIFDSQTSEWVTNLNYIKFTLVGAADTQDPSVPTNLTATAVSSSQINLSWTASTDNVGVIGYRIYRAGTQIATADTASYQNTGLSASTAYSYTVAAYDAAGNVSAQSSSASATTQVAPPTNHDPIGSFDTADATHVAGWAYDQDDAAYQVNVDIYIDGTNRARVTANLNRPDIVGAGGGLVGDPNHGFNFSLASLNLSSGSHTINIYAINTPTGNNPLLSGSPKTITIGGAADTTAPSVPSNLTATAVSSSQINLSWTASTDNIAVTGYRIYRAGTQIATSNTTSYQNTGLSPATAYSYTVAAYDAAGNVSAQSGAASAITKAASSTKFQLNDRVSVTANLNVRTTPSTSGTLLGTQPSGSLGIVIGGSSYADGYWWWNINFDSNPDGWATENNLEKYAAPNYKTITIKDSYPNDDCFTWTATYSPYPTYIILNNEYIRYGTYSGGSSAEDRAGIRFRNVQIPKDANIISAKITFYSQSPNGSGSNANFIIYGESTDNCAAYIDSWDNLIIRTKTNSYADWNNVPALNPGISYDSAELKTIIQEIKSRSGWMSNNSLCFQIIPAASTPAGTYRQAFSYDSGRPDFSPVLTITYTTIQTDTQAPSVPTNLTATAISSSQINLSWTASTDNIAVTGYRIFRAGTQIATVNTISYQNTGLSPATAYSYTVSASDAAGNVSAQSGAASATTQAAPPTNHDPIGSFDTADSTHISGWAYDQDATTNPINIDIYIDGTNRARVTANLNRPDIVGTGNGMIGDANHGFNYSLASLNLTAGSHAINIYAINTPTGNNPLLSGSPKTITIAGAADTTAPSVPTNLSATAVSSSQINLSWTASIDNVAVTGYRIYRAGTQIATVNTTSYQNTGLSPSTAYSYTVATYDVAGNVSSQSGSASATTPAGPAINYLPVGNLDVADGQHIKGWAYDANANETPINVLIYIDKRLVVNIPANLPRPDILNARGGMIKSINHGFDFSIKLTGFHRIQVYGVNMPKGTNSQLSGSPKLINIPK